MPSIAQAVVTIRPDLTGFATALRADLEKTLSQIGKANRTIYINAQLAPQTKASLQLQLNKISGLTVEVMPTLSLKGVASLKAQLGVIPIEVALAGGQTQKIRTEIASAAATAGGIAGATGATATKGSVDIASQEARAAAATENLTKAQLGLNAALTATEVDLEKVALAEAKLGTSTAALAAETEKLAFLRQKAAIPIVSPQEQAAVAAQIEADKAAAAEKAALAKAQADAAAAAEIAATRIANAEAALAAATEVVATASNSQTAALEANAVIKEQLRAIDLELAAATKAGDTETAASIATTKAKTEALAKEAEARALLNQVQLNQGILANAQPVTAAEALKNEALATQNLLSLENARALALEAGATAVAANAAGTIELADAQALEAANAAKALVTEEARAGVLAKIEFLQARIANATSSDFSLIQQRTKLIAIEQQLVIALEQYAKASSGATAADLRSLEVLETKVLALKAERTALIEAAGAAEAQAVTLSQAGRGAAATGASFLGLRGAVLSASSGFLAATVAVTAFAKIVGTAASLQQSLNVFQSVSEATALQMKAVSAEARSLGADLSLPATSANDAAQAMTELARAGLSVQDSMNAARGVLQLAAAANISVGDSSTIVATELNAFGLAGTQATRVADLLTGAAKSAQGEITDFALAFQQVAAVANQVKLPIETTTAILTQFAKAGLRGSDAGTSLRTMLLRLVPTTKAATEAQAALGIEINDQLPIGAQYVDLVEQYTVALAKLGPIAQQEALTKIFGQDAIRGATISLTNGAAALTKVQADISKPGLAAEQSAARMRGLKGAIEGLQSEVQTFAGSIGTTLLPTLEVITRDLSAVVKTADEAVQAIQKLGDVGIGNVTAGNIASQLAGPLGTIGLAVGAGVGLNKLRDFRQERIARKAAAAEAIAQEKLIQAAVVETGAVQVAAAEAGAAATVAGAEVAAASQAAGAKVGALAYETASSGIIIATEKQTAVQVAGAAEAAAAQTAAARTSLAGWKLTGAAVIAATKASVTAKALAIGAGLTIAGSLASQSGNDRVARAGSLASAVGTGAVLGSFIPGVGTAVGAGIGATTFGALELMNQSKKASAEKQAKLKAEWQSMTPEEQRDLIVRMFPDKANANIQNDILSLLARTTTKPPTRVNPQGEVVRARDFIKSVGGLNPEDQKALAELRQRNRARRAAAEAAAKEAFPLTSLDGGFATTTVARGPGGRLSAATSFADSELLKRLTGRVDTAKKFRAVVQQTTVAEAQLELAIAQANNSVSGQLAALDELATINQRKINSLQRQLNAPDPNVLFGTLLKTGSAARKEVQDELAKAIADQQKIDQQTQQLNAERLGQTPVNLTIAGIQAGATPGLGDNVSFAQAALAEANRDLARGKALFAQRLPSGQRGITKDELDALKIAQAQATAGLAQAEQSVSDQAKTDAEKAKSAAQTAAQTQIDALQFVADQAGNVGKAEDNLLAALKHQVDIAKKNTPEFVQAQRAYAAEQQKHMQAILGMAAAQQSLRDARTDFALQIAESTPGTKDNVAVLNKQIKNDQTDIATIRARIKNEQIKGEELIKLQETIIKEKADIFAKQQAIKDVNGGSGGFSLQDLFKESINQLQQFGSNVSTGVTIGGGARAAIAGAIAANNPNLTEADRKKLFEASKTNDLLAEILAELVVNNNDGSNVMGGKGGKTVRDPVGPGGFATPVHASHFTQVSRWSWGG